VNGKFESATGRTQYPNVRWVMIGLAFFATVINYLDRQTLTIVAPLLKKEFVMSDETYGLIISAFMLAYTIMNGVSGPLLDRIGTRLGYGLCMLWWSTAGILTSLARGPVSLGIFRFFLGMGEAGNWPAAIKITGEWFPPRERALASGIFNSGASIGALISPPLIAWLVTAWGWPRAFLLVGILGYLWLVGWMFVYYTPSFVRKEVQAKPAAPWILMKTRFVAFFTLSKVFIDPVWYFYIFWFAKYLSSVHGYTILQIGKIGWIPFLVADIGSWIGGMVPWIFIRHGLSVQTARRISVTIFALFMTSAVGVVWSPTVAWALVFISIAAFGYTGYSANTMAFPADVFPKNMIGSIFGLASMGAGFGGMLFNWLYGRTIDRLGYHPVFIAVGIMPVIALVIVLFFMGPLQPDPRFAIEQKEKQVL
jgi:MFS transporter, ACS family, hexuronate transporter